VPRVGCEAYAAFRVEFFEGKHQAEIALTNQIGERNSVAPVSERKRDDHAKVSANQGVRGTTIPGITKASSQLDFPLMWQYRGAASNGRQIRDIPRSAKHEHGYSRNVPRPPSVNLARVAKKIERRMPKCQSACPPATAMTSPRQNRWPGSGMLP
jgi:hypothetical protein